jgi:hypothetical protein
MCRIFSGVATDEPPYFWTTIEPIDDVDAIREAVRLLRLRHHG